MTTSDGETGSEPAVDFVELHFTDVTGSLKSVVLPGRQRAETLAYGHWFDGSALEGGARAMEADLILRPVEQTWGVLPWAGRTGARTGRYICDVRTPDDMPSPVDPRAALVRAEASAADLSYRFVVGAEVEFYLLPGVPAEPAAEPPPP